MKDVYVTSAGLFGPGLNGWKASCDILAGGRAYCVAPTQVPIPTLLPATERRRSTEAVRLAVAAGQDALENSAFAGHELATVFSTSDGDGRITHQICEGLAQPEREVSPTAFHNSVCNAPAGYWSIAVQSLMTSTTICAHDLSVAAGLLEAAVLVAIESMPVMLVVSDLPFPAPLNVVRSMQHSFAAAFLLSSNPVSGARMRWGIRIVPRVPATSAPPWSSPEWWGNPAARCLPLLATLAAGTRDVIAFDSVGETTLMIDCDPMDDR